MTFKIYRIVYRIDFKPVFEFIDSQGRIMRAITDVSENFWKAVGSPAGNPHLVRAYLTEPNVAHRDIFIEPTSINGTIETSTGIDPTRLDHDPTWVNIGKSIDAIMQAFTIRNVVRCGIRTLMFSHSAEREIASLQRALKTVDPALVGRVQSQLGEITDFGYTFQGNKDQEVFYRATFGPFAETDIANQMQTLGSDLSPEDIDSPNFTVDIDVWQKDFSFKDLSWLRWCRPKWRLAAAAAGLMDEQAG